jgi:hypothetical protein
MKAQRLMLYKKPADFQLPKDEACHPLFHETLQLQFERNRARWENEDLKRLVTWLVFICAVLMAVLIFVVMTGVR